MTTAVAAKPTATPRAADVPNDLAAFWMPFTPNRAFKRNRASSYAPRTSTITRPMAVRSWTRGRALVLQCRA